jgi:hypothetical protein
MDKITSEESYRITVVIAALIVETFKRVAHELHGVPVTPMCLMHFTVVAEHLVCT